MPDQPIANNLKKSIFEAVKTAFPDVEISLEDISLEHPAAEEFGDYSTNIALRLAKQTKQKPMDIANGLKNMLSHEIESMVDRVEVASPGFINFKLSTEELVSQMKQALEEGERYGSSTLSAGKTVVIDYSAPNIAKRFSIAPGTRRP